MVRPLSAFPLRTASVLETVFDDGAATSTVEIDVPYDDAVYVRADGRFYRIERSVRAERELTGRGFRLHTLTCTRGVVAAEKDLERARADAVAFSDSRRSTGWSHGSTASGTSSGRGSTTRSGFENCSPERRQRGREAVRLSRSTP